MALLVSYWRKEDWISRLSVAEGGEECERGVRREKERKGSRKERRERERKREKGSVREGKRREE